MPSNLNGGGGNLDVEKKVIWGEERPSEEKANEGFTSNATGETHYNAQDDPMDGARGGGGGGVIWKWYVIVNRHIWIWVTE